MPNSVVSVTVPKYVFKRMAMLPVNLPHLLAELGIAPTALLAEETTLTLVQYHQLWHCLERLCDDPAIGLKVASSVQPEHFGVVSYSMITSPTLDKGFALLAKYNRARGLCYFDVLIDELQALINIDWPVDCLPEHHCESALVYLVSLFRWVTNVDIKPQEVHFRCQKPSYSELLVDFFGAPVRFGQTREKLVFATSDFTLPIVWHDSALNKAFIGSASDKLTAKRNDRAFSQQVSEVIAQALAFGNPVAEDVAKKLNVSLRTLHRKLKNEQRTFQQLLDEVRKRLALAFIEVDGVEFKEIAYRLGYANLSGFYRAFNRWTGLTPMAFRNQRQTR